MSAINVNFPSHAPLVISVRKQGDTPFFPNMLNNSAVEVCLKEDVDLVLKAAWDVIRSLERKRDHYKKKCDAMGARNTLLSAITPATPSAGIADVSYWRDLCERRTQMWQEELMWHDRLGAELQKYIHAPYKHDDDVRRLKLEVYNARVYRAIAEHDYWAYKEPDKQYTVNGYEWREGCSARHLSREGWMSVWNNVRNLLIVKRNTYYDEPSDL